MGPILTPEPPKGDPPDAGPILRFYSVRQVALILGVSTATVYRLAAARKLPHSRVGCGRGTIRFEHAQIRAYLDRRDRPSPTPGPRPNPPHLFRPQHPR